IDSELAATGELLYEFIKFLDVKITKDMAINLYTAILTDTGGFKFSNTSDKTFSICSELVKAGADPYLLYQKCYGSKPYKMVLLHSYCISNVNLIEKDRIAWFYITRKLLQDMDVKDEYTDGIVESFRVIDNVEISVLFKETVDGNIKVSLRSKDKNVCSVAKEFNGGGHTLAAGCTLKGTDFEKVKTLVLSRLKNLL
ncbi:MAG: bifunctional oligoribonuclease/PAP phosphatase NrnA, partial [Vampirovibrionia bacterium]